MWPSHLLVRFWLTFLLGTLIISNVSAKTLVVLTETDSEAAVFRSILSGITDASSEIDIRIVEPSGLAQLISSSPKQYQSVIVLGRELAETPFDEPSEVPVLLGGYSGALNVAESARRMSLNIDPTYLVQQIKKTKGTVVKLRTTLSPQISTTPEAAKLTESEKIEVEISIAQSERDAAKRWFNVVTKAIPKNDVILIMDDQYLDSSGTYRFLIETAWKRRVLVASSIPNYARRGVSIGFIPVLPAYGGSLVEAAKRMAQDDTFIPNRLLGGDVLQRVFNKRTLENAGGRLPADLDRGAFTDIVIK